LSVCYEPFFPEVWDGVDQDEAFVPLDDPLHPLNVVVVHVLEEVVGVFEFIGAVGAFGHLVTFAMII